MKKQLLLLFAVTAVVMGHAQITLVKDINPGTGNGNPANLIVFDNKIFMAADDSSGINTGGVDYGSELWISDGTEAGTVFVKDANPGSGNGTPSFFFIYNNTLYYSANSGSGNVLWTSDGTEAGTTTTGAGFVFNPTELNGLIYYVNTTDSNALYVFNGTTGIPAPISGVGTSNLLGANLTAVNGKILCSTTYSEDNVGRELYEYDPNTEIFSLIKDITAGTGNSSLSNFTALGNQLYFTVSGALWTSDGTETGTIDVAVATTAGLFGLSNLYVWNDKLFFEGDDGTNDQLWVYDPVADTVTNVSNITGSVATGGNNHDPSDFVPYDGFLYYAGEIADDTRQFLFRTDGVTSVRLNSDIFDIDDIVVYNNILYFEGDDGITGNELYQADPTTLSTGETVLEIVNVFPNPAKDHIIFSENMIGKSYTIFDASGKQVSQGTLSTERLDLNFSNGLYLIKVTSDNSIFTKKIIIN